jgi:hypothetical protein
MKFINASIAVSLASAATGWITGQAIAALHYYLLRGAVHHSGGGIGLYVVLAAVNLAISVGVASMAADAIGAGNSAKIGAHAFSWGICYAYGQAFHDVRHGTWLHE